MDGPETRWMTLVRLGKIREGRFIYLRRHYVRTSLSSFATVVQIVSPLGGLEWLPAPAPAQPRRLELTRHNSTILCNFGRYFVS